MKKLLALFLLTMVVVMPVEAKKKKYPNGDYYEGGWKKKSPHGEGTMIYANGEKYVGTWEYGKKNGHGVFNYKDGSKYDGNWSLDKRSGQGVFTIGNKEEKYSGTWSCDTLTTGKAEYSDCVATGYFNSKFQLINGKISFKDGDYIEGLFKDNVVYRGKLRSHKDGDNPVFAEGDVDEDGFKGIKSSNTQFANGNFDNQGKLTNGEFVVATQGLYSEGLMKDGITNIKELKSKRLHKCTLLNFEGITDGGIPVSGSGFMLFDISDTTSLPQDYQYEEIYKPQGQWNTAANSEMEFRSRCSRNIVVFDDIELDKIGVVFHRLDTAVEVKFSIEDDTYHKVISTLNEDVFWSSLIKETESIKEVFQQKAIGRLIGHVFEGELVSDGAWSGCPFRFLVEWKARLEFVDENDVVIVWDARPKTNSYVAEALAKTLTMNYESDYQYRKGKVLLNGGEDTCKIIDDGSKIELYWRGQLDSHGYLHQVK